MRFLALLLLAAISPVFGANAQTMYLVPDGAMNVDHAESDPGKGAEDFFWLQEKYPGTSALAHYRRIFADWRPCVSKKGWSSDRDVVRSGGKDETVYIHRIMEHWVNQANDTAVTAVLTYSSFHPEPGSRQFVRLHRIKTKNAEQFLHERAGANCRKGA
jgi:hypothetical protein